MGGCSSADGQRFGEGENDARATDDERLWSALPVRRLWSPESGEPLPPAAELYQLNPFAPPGADGASPPTLSRRRTESIECRGVAFGWVVAFTEAFGIARKPTSWVVENVIKPLTAASPDGELPPCRFVDLRALDGVVGRADTFASHAWAGLWGDLVVGVGRDVSAGASRARVDARAGPRG